MLTPATVVGSDYFENLSIVNVGRAMAQMPQNANTHNPIVGSDGAGPTQNNFYVGANIANLRGLNPAHATRTLTLVDSRRHVAANQVDNVDLNFIPAIRSTPLVAGSTPARPTNHNNTLRLLAAPERPPRYPSGLHCRSHRVRGVITCENNLARTLFYRYSASWAHWPS